jgi:16S rRNA processing protein RimM
LTTPAPRRRYVKREPAQPREQAPAPEPTPETLDPETAVSVGRITSIHGIKGELRVMPLTDFPERFDAGQQVWLDGAPYTVRRRRWQGREMILALEGIEDRDTADAQRGKELLVPSPKKLDDDVFYQHDIIGLRAVTPEGEILGRIADVLSTGSNDVYVVQGDRGELLLPALEDVVREIDIAAGRMVVEVIEGLEFTRSAAPRPRRPSGEERRLAGEPKEPAQTEDAEEPEDSSEF